MKRLSSSDSLVPICPSGFQTVFDDEEELVNAGDDDLFSLGGCAAPGQPPEKKRRLSAEQVRALEKNFEVENKLEPERKVRLAQELGLQPRQVAVWFQNRRARWKTKQLERDYAALKGRYDALRLDHDALLGDKDSLLAEVKDLKAKLNGGDEDTGFSSAVKEEPAASESENKAAEPETLTLAYNKDVSSDSSDSSAALSDENSPLAGNGSIGGAGGDGGAELFYHQQQLLKVDDGFLDGEEPCSFFDDDQPAALWYGGGGGACSGSGW